DSVAARRHRRGLPHCQGHTELTRDDRPNRRKCSKAVGAFPVIFGGGIINDFQSLMKQEVALARRELADELRKAKQAAISLGIGVGILAIGGLLLIFMLVHLLSWAVPAIPLWACYGIIGGLLILAGGALLLRAKAKA